MRCFFLRNDAQVAQRLQTAADQLQSEIYYRVGRILRLMHTNIKNDQALSFCTCRASLASWLVRLRRAEPSSISDQKPFKR